MDAGSFNIKAALSGAPAAILRGTAGTASQCTASSYASSSYLPDEAWNGVKDGADGFNDVWRCNTVPNTDGSVYIQWEFGEAKNLTGFRFETRSNVVSGETSWPDDVKWLGKTSAQSWAEATTLYDGAISGASGLSPGDWCAWHDFTTTGDFDDYRMEIHSAFSYGASDGKPHIQEVEFSSVAVPATGCTAYSGFFVADLEQAAGTMFPFRGHFSMAAGPIQVTTIPRTRQFWRVTLTGHADGVANIELPTSSVQVRARSGDPTYLQATIPGMAYADEIADRENGQIVVEIVYKDSSGNVLQAEEIARVDMSAINTYEGGNSSSIVIEGRRTTTHAAKAVTLAGTTYRSFAYGRVSCRIATPDPYLRPGDTVTTDQGDTFEVDSITYILSPRQQSMEIAQA